MTNTYRYKGSFNYANITNRQLHGAQGSFYIGVVNGYYQTGQGGTSHSSIQAEANTFVDFDIFFDTTNGKAIYTIGGTSGNNNASYNNSPNYAHIFVFALNGNTLPSTCKVSKFQLYENEVLIRNYIPCYRKSDNVIGMYDIVTKTFFTNAGTGTFTKGNNVTTVTPTPDAPVEIFNVTGDNNVVVSNKNLLDLTKHTNTLASNTTIIDSNTIQCEATGNWQGRVIVPLQLRKNTQYTISAKTEGNATRCLVSRINGTINGTTTAVVSNQYYDYFKNGYTFNSGNYDKWEMDFYVTGNNSPTGTLKVEELQIEESDRKTNYIAHQGNSYRVDLGGKNLVTPQYVQNAQNVENTLNADGSITSIGTPNTGYYNITTEMPIDLPAGTYTFSIDKTRQYLTALSLQNEGGTRESKYIRIGDKSVTFTTTEKKIKFYFWSYATNGTPVNETIKYQLEKRKYSNSIQSIYSNPYRTK